MSKMRRKPKATLLEDDNRQRILDSLPVCISALEIQKNDSTRVSVFGDKDFLFGLPLNVVEKLNLSKSQIIDEDKLLEIESAAVSDSIRSWLLKLLGSKSYSRKQLEKISKDSKYDLRVVNLILDEFEEKRWLDDEQYAMAYTRDKINFQKWGPSKIRENLKLNGINDGIIDCVFKELILDEEQTLLVRTLIEKRKKHFLRETDTLKRKKKIIDYLLRKGYHHNVVFAQIDTLLKSLEK